MKEKSTSENTQNAKENTQKTKEHEMNTTQKATATAKEKNMKKLMTIYTACNIEPASSGFGMWQCGEKQIGPQSSYADLSDLVMAGELIDLDAALADEDFIAAGIEDIRGRIYNEPGLIYAVLGEEGDGSPCVRYFGVEEDEVPEDFFD